MNSIVCTILACLFFGLSPEIPIMTQKVFGVDNDNAFLLVILIFTTNLITLVVGVIMTRDENLDWIARLGLFAIIAGSFTGTLASGSFYMTMTSADLSWEGIYTLFRVLLASITDLFMIGTIIFQFWGWRKEERDRLQMSLEDE